MDENEISNKMYTTSLFHFDSSNIWNHSNRWPKSNSISNCCGSNFQPCLGHSLLTAEANAITGSQKRRSRKKESKLVHRSGRKIMTYMFIVLACGSIGLKRMANGKLQVAFIFSMALLFSLPFERFQTKTHMLRCLLPFFLCPKARN